MKKIIFIVLMFFISFLGHSQATLDEKFEGTSTPDDSGNWALDSGTWKVFDNGVGLLRNWGPTTSETLIYEGRSAYVQREGLGNGLTSEEWLVTPRKRMRANESLRFFTRQLILNDNGTKYEIRVSRNPDPLVKEAYTTVKTYTENDLNPDGIVYNEKTVSLGDRIGQDLYIAFVKVYAQDTDIAAGDGWLIDNVRLVPLCVTPTGIAPDPLTARTATLLWTHPLAGGQFEVRYGLDGFDLESGGIGGTHFVTGTSFPIVDLQPGTRYAFYVRAVCSGDVTSEWSQRSFFDTYELGATCEYPIVVTTPLPYSDLSNTQIYGNHIDRTSPGTTCGATGNYLSGLDVVYSYTADQTGQISISMNPNGAVETGVFVYSSCSTIGNSCLAGVANANASVRNIPAFNVVEGTTYYIVISSKDVTFNFQYLLLIQKVSCAAPAAAVAPILPAVVTGQNSALLSWGPSNTTALAWQVSVQLAGTSVPGEGDPSIITPDAETRTNYPVNGLNAGTQYQYWVRARCADGTYSPWTGPFLFTTSICPLDDQCTYKFNLRDSGGDGWGGGRMVVRQNGLVVATLGSTLTGSTTAPVDVKLCKDIPFELFWSVAGNAPSDVRISITNPFNQVIYNMNTSSPTLFNTVLTSQTVDCSNALCLPPTTLNVTPGIRNAVLSWPSVSPSPISYTVYVVQNGEEFPGREITVPADPNSATQTYTVEDLIPETGYQYFVRSFCTVNNPGVLSSPKSFTTLPSCKKPTALVVDPGAYGARLSWTSPDATAWQIMVIPATDPAPVAGDTRWVDAPSNPFDYNPTPPLNTDFAYVYYVRANCGAVDGFSSPAGPKAFRTDITCVRPTSPNVTANTITMTSAQLTWNNGTNSTATSWQVIALPAGSAPPAINATGWVPAPTNPFVLTGLEPGTCYDYYVRGNCGDVNGLSSWSTVKNFCTLVCEAADKCNYLISVNSTGTDGFGGAVLRIRQNGIIVGNPITAATTPATGRVISLCDGVPFELVWSTAGDNAAAIRVPFIKNSFGQIIYSMTTSNPNAAGTTLFTGTVNCQTPLCLPPTTLGAVPGIDNARLTWVNPGEPTTSLQVYNVLAGTEPPSDDQTVGVLPATGNFLDVTDLQPNTAYEFYVRSVCTVNSPSVWAGPFQYLTLPTCPQPITPIVTSTDSGAIVTWHEAGIATHWQVVVTSSGTGGPTGFETIYDVPAVTPPADPSFNTSTIQPALGPGFYEFYIRSICSDTDQSFWTGPVDFFVAVPPPVCAAVDINIGGSSTGGVLEVCPSNSCVDLVADFEDVKQTTTYTVLPARFAPPFPFTGGIPLDITQDDIWGPQFPLPFQFCFYGQTYSQVQVGSNGVISFDMREEGSNCAYRLEGVQIPDEDFVIPNAIYGVYQDIDPLKPSPLKSINYQVLGEAPCRAFVVNFYQIPQFGSECQGPEYYQTSQVVMYETSNIIEVYVQDRKPCMSWPTDDTGGEGLIGIQNGAGTLAQVPPNRNTGAWEAHNEAWRFTPNGASNVAFSWLQDGREVSTDHTLHLCATENTTITAKAVYTGCGGQQATKTKELQIRMTAVALPEFSPVEVCTDSYQLPPLTEGGYFSEPNGQNPLTSMLLTQSQTVYVFASTTTTPPCTQEKSFPVIIGGVHPPQFETAAGCLSYTLPVLPAGFNYFDQPNGLGNMYAGDSQAVITTNVTPMYIYGVSASGLCTGQTQFNITIGATVTPNFVIAPYCEGTTPPVLPATSPNAITGTWTPATITGPGDYVFNPNAGQCAILQTVTVTTIPTETADFDATLGFCSGTTAPVLATTSPNGILGNWSPSTISNTTSGEYVFTPIPVAGRCFEDFRLTVTVSDVPSFSIDGGCDTNNVYTIEVPEDAFPAGETVTYSWSDALGNPAGTTREITPAMTGTYTCVVSLSGCEGSDVWYVPTLKCGKQKGISPKGTGPGDGKNDYFDLEGQNVTELEIFNRYGTKVYSLANYTNQWYGQSKKGEELPDGTYYFVIKRSTAKPETGWIYINREK